MLDFITQLLDAEIDYIGLLTFVFIYISIMWLMFCGWVYIDARKKFDSMWVAVLFTLFVFPLNIPGFILYLIVRPEHEDWSDLAVLDGQGHQHHLGGVQVPLVHFTGDEGEVQMTFGLSINPKQITSGSPDMNIDVSWDSNQASMEMGKAPAVQTVSMQSDGGSDKKSAGLSALSDLGSRFRKSISSVSSTVGGSISSSTKQLEQEDTVPEKTSEGEKPAEAEHQENKKKSKKEKRKKKK